MLARATPLCTKDVKPGINIARSSRKGFYTLILSSWREIIHCHEPEPVSFIALFKLIVDGNLR